MKYNKFTTWVKSHKTELTVAGGVVLTMVGKILFDKKKNSLDSWLTSASDEELSTAYETRRKEWASTGFGGDGEKTPEMKKIDKEMSRRSAEKWKSDPRRNKDPNYRWTDANRWDKD